MLRMIIFTDFRVIFIANNNMWWFTKAMALDNAAYCMCLENILCLVADQHACMHSRENVFSM